MIPSSTNLYHCIHKYPAFSKKKKKEESKAIQKKGNHNIISIFSFLCLNWHEEYNQISLLTVTHAASGEGEISFTIIDLLATLSSFFPFFGPSVSIVALLFRLWRNYLTSTCRYLHLLDMLCVKQKKKPTRGYFNCTFSSLESPAARVFFFFSAAVTKRAIERRVAPVLPLYYGLCGTGSIWALWGHCTRHLLRSGFRRGFWVASLGTRGEADV